MKKLLAIAALIAVAGILVFGTVGQVEAKSDNYGFGNGGNGQGQGSGMVQPSGSSALPAATSTALSAQEIDDLLFMREEEKLAQDVYAALYAEWGLPVFQNIGASEQAHTSAVKTLMDRYGLSDPASTAPGVFTNPALQALYNNLIVRGSQSLAEALKVGAAIEEIDILDLQERIAQTGRADLQQVYTNLLNGSYNHLRAFTSTLQTQVGETYQPQYLTAAAYSAILNSAGTGGWNAASRGYGMGKNNLLPAQTNSVVANQ